MTTLRLALARRLEQGAFDSLPARALSRAWAHFSDPVRPLGLPRGARVIGVGGATLGGSGKTPFVLALARALAADARVGVVGDGYDPEPAPPHRVRIDDAVSAVGDEALWLARALACHDVPVWVGRSRERTLARAAEGADVVIADGLLQTRPERLALSLLVTDAETPWGSGRCPPAGDLRAAPARVLAACDEIVAVKGSVDGAERADGTPIPLSELRALRLGLVLAIARPERVLALCAAERVVPRLVELAYDHGRPRTRPAAAVDAWLATAKCATKLGTFWGGAPVWVLRHRVEVPPPVLLRALARTSDCRDEQPASAW
jgi:tetraacyldisaccharide 4'-kinase